MVRVCSVRVVKTCTENSVTSWDQQVKDGGPWVDFTEAHFELFYSTLMVPLSLSSLIGDPTWPVQVKELNITEQTIENEYEVDSLFQQEWFKSQPFPTPRWTKARIWIWWPFECRRIATIITTLSKLTHKSFNTLIPQPISAASCLQLDTSAYDHAFPAPMRCAFTNYRLDPLAI